MRKLVVGCLLPLSLLLSTVVQAQYTDTTAPRVNTPSTRLAIDWQTPPAKRIFPYKSFLLPASLVAYGVVSLHAKPLKHINEKIKEEVFTEPAPRAIHVDNYLQYATGLSVFALNVAGVHGKSNLRDRAMIYAMSNIIMSSSTFIIKRVAAEQRPDGSNNFSFPSGHTANAFAGAEFLRQEYKDISPWYGIAGYAAAAATGYLRISNNKHWMGDVAAGAGIGIMSTKLAYWLYPAIKRSLFKDREVTTMVAPAYQDGVFSLGMVHHF